MREGPIRGQLPVEMRWGNGEKHYQEKNSSACTCSLLANRLVVTNEENHRIQLLKDNVEINLVFFL